MKIEIYNAELADSDMLLACIVRVKRFYECTPSVWAAEIWVYPPDRDGMIDYGMRLPYPSGGQIIIHAIRRPNSTEVEFHS